MRADQERSWPALVLHYTKLGVRMGDGRPLLDAAQRLTANRLRTVDYVDGWEDVARHTLRELAGVGSYARVVTSNNVENRGQD